jgi:hypothetical protein
MCNKTKIAFSVAIVLGTVSGAFAATKHPAHKTPAVHAAVSTSAYGAYGSVNGNSGRVVESGAMGIQDRDWSEQVGGQR